MERKAPAPANTREAGPPQQAGPVQNIYHPAPLRRCNALEGDIGFIADNLFLAPVGRTCPVCCREDIDAMQSLFCPKCSQAVCTACLLGAADTFHKTVGVFGIRCPFCRHRGFVGAVSVRALVDTCHRAAPRSPFAITPTGGALYLSALGVFVVKHNDLLYYCPLSRHVRPPGLLEGPSNEWDVRVILSDQDRRVHVLAISQSGTSLSFDSTGYVLSTMTGVRPKRRRR